MKGEREGGKGIEGGRYMQLEEGLMNMKTMVTTPAGVWQR